MRGFPSTTPLPLSDHLISPAIIISNTSPHPSLQSSYQIVHLGFLCTAEVSFRTYQRIKAPEQAIKPLPPALVRVYQKRHRTNRGHFSRGGNNKTLTFWHVGQIADDAESRVCFSGGVGRGGPTALYATFHPPHLSWMKWERWILKFETLIESLKGPRNGNRNGVRRKFPILSAIYIRGATGKDDSRSGSPRFRKNLQRAWQMTGWPFESTEEN